MPRWLNVATSRKDRPHYMAFRFRPGIFPGLPVIEANVRGSVRADSDVARESMEGCGVTLEARGIAHGLS